MERFQSWDHPLPFIVTENNKLIVDPKTAALLAQITQPVVVVAIAGSYRTGKSYLMNRLARKQLGFPLGSELQSKTKGIWMWCVDNPVKPNTVLVLIDTEGLSDPEKNDDQHDMMVFSLAVLLSSTFVFNATGKIDQTMIDKLYFVTELTEHIKVKASCGNSENGDQYEDYMRFFPIFVLAVRDFTLELKIDGEDVTPDEYFEHILKLKKGTTKSIVNYNLPREAIRNAFKSHHCFVFTRPVHDESLFPRLEELEESELSAKFLKQSEKFCAFIFKCSSVKKVRQGQDMNGRLLLGMAEGYVQSINSGSVPCIESTVALVTERENHRVQEEAVNFYCQKMKALPYPVSERILKEAHSVAHEAAMKHFRNNCFFDEEGKFFEKVTEILVQEFFKYAEHNENASVNKCTKIIQQLHSAMLLENLKKGEFTRAGGYQKYEQIMQSILKEYQSQTYEETKAEEVKQQFLNEKETEREAIMMADSSMTEKDKEIENSKKLKEAAELDAKLKDEEVKTGQARLEQLQSEHVDEVQKLKVEFDEKQKQREKELQELIESRLKEKEKLLKEGFAQKAADLEQEIKRLQSEKNSKGFFAGLLDFADRLTNIFANVAAVRSLWKSIPRSLPNAASKRPPL